MSEHLERAAAALRETKAFRASAAFGVPNEAWGDCSRMMLRATLRAYQAPREWGEADIQRLPVGALFVDERGHVYRLGAHGLLFPPGSSVGSPTYTLGPLRLVYNPDDLKED